MAKDLEIMQSVITIAKKRFLPLSCNNAILIVGGFAIEESLPLSE